MLNVGTENAIPHRALLFIFYKAGGQINGIMALT